MIAQTNNLRVRVRRLMEWSVRARLRCPYEAMAKMMIGIKPMSDLSYMMDHNVQVGMDSTM